MQSDHSEPILYAELTVRVRSSDLMHSSKPWDLLMRPTSKCNCHINARSFSPGSASSKHVAVFEFPRPLVPATRRKDGGREFDDSFEEWTAWDLPAEEVIEDRLRLRQAYLDSDVVKFDAAVTRLLNTLRVPIVKDFQIPQLPKSNETRRYGERGRRKGVRPHSPVASLAYALRLRGWKTTQIERALIQPDQKKSPKAREKAISATYSQLNNSETS
jgi:hypothetical protein